MKKISSFALLGILLLSMFAFSSNLVIAEDNDTITDDNETGIDNVTDDTVVDNVTDDEETEDKAIVDDDTEEAEVDEETEEETEIMDTQYGAQIRLYQLERAVRRRILWANAVIDVLQEKGEDVSDLQEIVSELELLVDEIQEIPADRTNEDAVKDFVNIKSDARDLIKDFREKARPLLSAEDREALIEKFKEIDRTELKDLTEKIREQRRLRNAEMVQKLLNVMNVENDELINQIKAGEITPLELRDRLREHFNSLSDEEKADVKQKLKRAHIKRRVLRLNRIAKAREERLQTISERLTHRAELLEEKGFANASARLRTRAEVIEARSERISNVRERIKERIRR